MARHIHEQGGNVKGNAIDSSATTRYSSDPAIAPAGMPQKRNFTGSSLPNNRGTGVSLGAWASTAVCDSEQQRKAIRVITVEFPGTKRPTDYTGAESEAYQRQLQLYTEAISLIFLGEHYPEPDNQP